MKLKYLSLSFLTTLAAVSASAQDLVSKIPSDAEFVVSINNKAISKNGSDKLIDELFQKIGVYSSLATEGINSDKLSNFPVDLQKNSYVYRTVTDSISYVVALLPLNPQTDVTGTEAFPLQGNKGSIDGYQVQYFPQQEYTAIYNQNTLMVVYSFLSDNYFEKEEVIERYGLERQVAYNPWDSLYNQEAVEWEAYDFDQQEEAQECSDPDHNHYQQESIVAVEVEEVEEEYEYVEEYEENSFVYDYTDQPQDVDYQGAYDSAYDTQGVYLQDSDVYFKNDSIKSVLSEQWTSKVIGNIINPEKPFSAIKQVSLQDDKTLARLYVDQVNSLYYSLLGFSNEFNPFSTSTIPRFISGYNQMSVDLIIDKNELQIVALAHMDKDMSKFTKKVFNRKSNRKFSSYIPEDVLGFVSLNINTKEYIKRTPEHFFKQYGQFLPGNDDIIKAVTIGLEVTLDPKSLSKVLSGDMVVYLNDVSLVTREYIGYDYDEDYNYIEVPQTKEDYAISYLAVGSSKDQRLFKALLDIAVKRDGATYDPQSGIYTQGASYDISEVYYYFKQGLVFVGTDKEQMQSIADGSFKTSTDNSIKKQLRKNLALNGTFNTSMLPGVLDKLDIPLQGEIDALFPEIERFGQMKIQTGVKGSNKLYSKFSIAFPKDKQDNALAFMLEQFLNSYN